MFGSLHRETLEFGTTALQTLCCNSANNISIYMKLREMVDHTHTYSMERKDNTILSKKVNKVFYGVQKSAFSSWITELDSMDISIFKIYKFRQKISWMSDV